MSASDSVFRKTLGLFKFSEGVFNDVAGWWAATKAEFLSGDNTFTGKITASGGVEGDLTGNASTATKLATARSINVQDSDGTHTGTAASFDGTSDATIKIPSTINADITGSVTGCADTTTKIKIQKSITIKDASQSHAGTPVPFDGSANVDLKLPESITATVAGDVTGGITVPNNKELMYRNHTLEDVFDISGVFRGVYIKQITRTKAKYDFSGLYVRGETYTILVICSANEATVLTIDNDNVAVKRQQITMVKVNKECEETGTLSLYLVSSTSYLKSVSIFVFTSI